MCRALLHGKLARTNRIPKEIKITHHHKSAGEYLLEESMHEFLFREGTLF